MVPRHQRFSEAMQFRFLQSLWHTVSLLGMAEKGTTRANSQSSISALAIWLEGYFCLVLTWSNHTGSMSLVSANTSERALQHHRSANTPMSWLTQTRIKPWVRVWLVSPVEENFHECDPEWVLLKKILVTPSPSESKEQIILLEWLWASFTWIDISTHT